VTSARAQPGRPERRRRGVDPRLRARLLAVRGWLAASVAVGVGLTACLVAQAVALGDLLSRLFHPPVSLREVTVELVVLAAAGVARALLLSAGAGVGAAAANRVRCGLRHDGLEALLGRGPGWLSGERSGELAVTLGRGLDALDVYVGDYLPRLVLAGAAPVVLLVAIGLLDWLSVLILLVALALVPVFMILVGRLTEQRVARRWRALTLLGGHFLDAVSGMATLRAYGRARRQEAEIARVTDDLRRSTLAVLREAFLSALILETLAAVATALVAVPLALRLLDGEVGLSAALAVLVLTPEVFLPLRRASSDFHAAAEGLSASDRALDIVEGVPLGATPIDGAPVAIVGTTARQEPAALPAGLEPAAPAAVQVTPRPAVAQVTPAACSVGPGRPGRRVPVAASGERPPAGRIRGLELRAHGLDVSYPGRAERVLIDVGFTIQPGERVALVGESGAGKSTLLAAVLGLLAVERGGLSLGDLVLPGVDPEQWRQHFAYLPQRPRLLAGTLLDNLNLGWAPPREGRDTPAGVGRSPVPAGPAGGPARETVIDDALRVADVAELVARLPGGLGAPLGEGGAGLSTGERQRLGLARALCRVDAEVVVLDEPTAHLDSRTEARLVEQLDGWLGPRTLLVASHRQGLLELADRVVTVDGGRLLAGTARRSRRAAGPPFGPLSAVPARTLTGPTP